MVTRRFIRSAVVCVALVAASTVPAALSSSASTPLKQKVDLPYWVTRPCKTEDSVNCRWIATGPRAEGNDTGHTFVVRRVPGNAGMVCVFYAQRAYARTHDYCQSGVAK